MDANADANIEKAVLAIVSDLEREISGSKAMAVVMANSALAAAEIIISSYDIRKSVIKTTYENLWQPAVDRLLE